MKQAPRILVIDDEKAIRDVLKLHLKTQKYEIAEATSGHEGLLLASEFHPHLIILDLGLLDMNGYDVLKELRTWTTVPVVVLTVSDDEATKVRLLDAGADDYLTKPFGTSELLARVRVGLRNHGLVEATPIFESDDLRVDLSQRLVTVLDQIIRLTNTEYEVLARLVRNPGQVVPQIQLLKEIWGAGAQEESHYLRIYIKQLRKKIEVNPSEPRHIITEPGVGYRIV
ncbi:MAG: DNA-binding response regulator [Bdellovibrionales bacterium RIFCSPHIGHO2_01_FULL_40_29]|nr:MAG: DNA-binding response regulator [Bdellovibrionales bacterium RIFCSPHIGHO2_01_FULL_40_29]OFZ34250.1 MAG: DNA-binding response regulator [Bdellovibrionales bacterium RIFCSPHIGHO2_02_FULL_40_15]